MGKTYEELYDKLIGEKFRASIIKYDPQSKRYKYCGYSHKVEENALDNLSEMIINDMVFYAFTEKEIVKLNDNIQILSDLRSAAKYAYVERLPKRLNSKSDGTMGEVLLDIFIQLSSTNTKKLVARAKHTEMNSRKEITGYDALYFTIEGNEKYLWLGQAKAGQKKYCKKSIVEDLQVKYKKEYFADTAFYIADKNEAKELENLLEEINKICFFAQIKKWNSTQKIDELVDVLVNNNVKLRIPCLISYTQDIYNDKDKLEQFIIAEMNDIISEFDIKVFPIDIGLDYEIIFYILPVKNVDYIRDKIVDLKKEVV